MDFYALQKKLFQMDPTDPRDDLRKLQEQARAPRDIAPTVNYLEETVQVNEGSLPLPGLDLDSFARLAGVRLDEKQKTGPAGQAKGSDPMPKAKLGRTKHPLQGKLVGGAESIEEGPLDAFAKGYQAVQPGGALGPDAASRMLGKALEPGDEKPKQPTDQKTKLKGSVSPQQLNKLIGVSDPGSFTQAIQKIKQPGGQKLTLSQQAALADAFVKVMQMDPQKTTQVMQLLKRMEAGESIQEKKQPEPPKQRNPVATYAQRSGAGVHKDQNKKNTPPRKEKHKSKSLQYESIKERLWEALNRNK